MADALSAIPAASKAFAAANPGATVAQQFNSAGQQSFTPNAPIAPPASTSSFSTAMAPSNGAQTPYNYVPVPANNGQVNSSGGSSSLSSTGANIGAAPAGAMQSANGLWYDKNGNAYTQAPAGGSTGGATGGATGLPNNAGGSSGPDSAYSAAMGAIAPTGPLSEEDFFNELYQQLAPVISTINGAEFAAETAAYAAGTNQQNDLSGELGGRGLAGSGDAAKEATNTNLATASAVASAKKDQSDALSTVYQFLSSDAWTEYTNARDNNQTLAQNYVSAIQSTAATTIKGLGEAGITSASDLQSKNPDAYLSLLQYYNGDVNALNSALLMATPQNKVIQSWVSGTTYNQLVTDPVTGKPVVQQTDLGVTPPTGWTSTKVSTNTILFQDPNNPSNTIVYTTDPISGGVTVQGTGSGQAIASQYSSSSTPSTDSSSSTPGTGTASTTVASALGVDSSTPFADVIASSGIGSIVAAMIQNEGGSPSGVVNNPGNVKYVSGMAGATDSGVKAADGGTFASFSTPEAGQAAIASTLNSIATKQGDSATLDSVVGAYTNTGSGTNSEGGGSGTLSPQQYGLLANVPGFNPNASGDAGIIDRDAYSYLKIYMSGTQPTNTNLTGKRAASSAEFQQAQTRAQDLYFQATGQQLPNIGVLAPNVGLIAKNEGLLNNLSVQTGVIIKNFGLSLDNENANNVNATAPVINKVVDALSQAAGSTSVAQYLSQNATLQQEIGSLLSVKNAAGVTVADKLAAGDLLPSDLSSDQQKTILTTLLKEAKNQQQTIGEANAALYLQTDPLGLDPQNPINQPGYQEFTAIPGFVNNYDGTWSAPDGSMWKAGTDGSPVPLQ